MDERKIALFGSTGSIGTQALEVLDGSARDKVILLAARNRWQELAEQANKLEPQWICLENDEHYSDLKAAISYNDTKIVCGEHACAEAAENADYDLCLNGLVGVAGLLPSYHALSRGIDLALANKESLVLAGDLLNGICAETDARIIPIDSEHSAIQQCIKGEKSDSIRRVILTASGGPFRTWDIGKIINATAEEALKHPTWKMGAKITVDSATLMNKGLEVIEAYHLFDVSVDQIEVRVHPVSIVHSMVEFVDGSFKAQLGKPDMRLPIRYALSYPERVAVDDLTDDPLNWPPLEFFPVEEERYPCLGLAFKALRTGDAACAVLNGADEAAVGAFLDGTIRFGQIHELVGSALDAYANSKVTALEYVLKADQWARGYVSGIVETEIRKTAV